MTGASRIRLGTMPMNRRAKIYAAYLGLRPGHKYNTTTAKNLGRKTKDKK